MYISLGRSSESVTSSTVSCSGTPTCWAARPTPFAARIVSIISAASAFTSSVISPTGFPFCRRTGSPYFTISSTMAFTSSP